MGTNEMPKGGIQQLRDAVILDLTVNDHQVTEADENMVENVVTLLQRAGKIQWDKPPEQRFHVLSTEQLRKIADQIDAYRSLSRAGADLGGGSLLSVNGKPMGHVRWTDRDVYLVIDTESTILPWNNLAQLERRYPAKAADMFEDDEEL